MNRAQRYRESERRLWDHVQLTPEERYIRVDGIGVRVQVIGDGPPVLMIHGSPNAGSTWAPIMPWLTGYRCHLVDRPGTGLSDDFVLRDDPYGFAQRFVPQVLDELGIERAHLVASSFGGFIALVSAAAAADRIGGMVQMACPAFVPGMATPGFMKAMSLRPVRWLMNALPPNEAAGRSILRQIGHGASLDANRIPPIFFEWYMALQRDTNTMRNDGEMIGRVATLRGLPAGYTIPDELFGAVTAPTLFLWGEDDAFGGPDVARRVVDLMPDASVRFLPGSGHLPWLDYPAVTGPATAAFLAEVEAGQTVAG